MDAEQAEEQARRLLERFEGWLLRQPARTLLPREDLEALVAELRQDEARWERLRPRFERAWERGHARLRGEQRTVRQLISARAAERVLAAFEAADPDPEVVRAFLRTPAIEAMLGSILYTGIFEFVRRADLLGAIVDRLPVLGPIRRKVMSVVKDELEPRLEGQIKAFLGGFSGLAVERMIQFVLSGENRDGFRQARRRLGEHLLDRQTCSLAPDDATSVQLRDAAWSALREGAVRDEPTLWDHLYADWGDEALGPEARLGPRARDVLVRALARHLREDEETPAAT